MERPESGPDFGRRTPAEVIQLWNTASVTIRFENFKKFASFVEQCQVAQLTSDNLKSSLDCTS